MKKMNRIILLFFLLSYLYPQTLKKELPAEGPIDIIERLGDIIALDAEFLNEKGESVLLKDFFYKDIPTIITLNYFECPMLCGLVLNGVGNSIEKINLKPGDEYQIITISIDPKESYKLANKKKNNYMKQYNIENLDENWTFLTGTYDNIKKVTDSIGFIYSYNYRIEEYIHPAAITIVSSEGIITRYLYNSFYPPRDLKLALLESGEGKIGSLPDMLLLSCFTWDPNENKYTLFAFNFMRVGGILTLIFIGLMLYNYWRKDHYLIGD